MRNDSWRSYLLSPLLLAAIPAVAIGQPASEPFKGQTISIEIGYGPGGGYDTYARALARHYGRFIPGNPAVVPKNMPGAGSLRAANYIFNLAPKDGTELGAWQHRPSWSRSWATTRPNSMQQGLAGSAA
jgi:tripartite-type tricarboxylate transporter receptor subunit TctC